MSWKIKFTYDTGNSFEQESGVEGYLCTTSSCKSYIWDEIEDAQETLRRLKEHYLWQDSLDTTYGKDLSRPEWWTGKFDPKRRFSGDDYFSFNAPGNDGEEIRLYAGTYMGYFDQLIGAEIESVIPDNDKNKITISYI